MALRIIFLWLLVMPAYAINDNAEALTVVELFTSQGCSSCPPADNYLGELAKRKNIIALSCHVTYWNYIGWKDTFSTKFCDHRQRQYQPKLLGGSRGTYTPQMIINGRYVGVGSRRSTIEAILDYDQREQVPVIAIPMHRQGSELMLQLPKIAARDTSVAARHQLFLLGTSGEHTLPITRGENSGKRLSHFNPVEYSESLGEWDGRAISRKISLPNNPAIQDWLVLAQTWPVGEIVAVGRLSVPR